MFFTTALLVLAAGTTMTGAAPAGHELDPRWANDTAAPMSMSIVYITVTEIPSVSECSIAPPMSSTASAPAVMSPVPTSAQGPLVPTMTPCFTTLISTCTEDEPATISGASIGPIPLVMGPPGSSRYKTITRTSTPGSSYTSTPGSISYKTITHTSTPGNSSYISTPGSSSYTSASGSISYKTITHTSTPGDSGEIPISLSPHPLTLSLDSSDTPSLITPTSIVQSTGGAASVEKSGVIGFAAVVGAIVNALVAMT